jgi:hypothetical protein
LTAVFIIRNVLNRASSLAFMAAIMSWWIFSAMLMAVVDYTG